MHVIQNAGNANGHYNNAHNNNENQEFKHNKHYCHRKILDIIFYIFCFITGQLLTGDCHGCFIVATPFFTLLNLILNLIPVIFNVYVIVKCPYINCGYIDIINTTTTDIILDPKKGNHENISKIKLPQPELPDKFVDFQKFLFNSSTISGIISYICIIILIYMQYLKRPNAQAPNAQAPDGNRRNFCDNYCDTCEEDNDSAANKNIHKLNPFTCTRNKDNTLLTCGEMIYFYCILGLTLAIFFSSVVIFFVLFFLNFKCSDKRYKLLYDIAGLICQFYLWFCAILSCFIFSKVAYAVTNMNSRLYACLDKVATGEEGEIRTHVERYMICLKDYDQFQEILDKEERQDSKILHTLKSIDRLYADILKDSLQPYSLWFIFHWHMYTLTAFLSVAYVIDAVKMELYNNENTCHGEPYSQCRLSLVYILLFSLTHYLLFLYPCFRAASVTASRYG